MVKFAGARFGKKRPADESGASMATFAAYSSASQHYPILVIANLAVVMRLAMRTLAVLIGIFGAGHALSAGAQAQTNPWCAYYSNGVTNCGFATLSSAWSR